MTPASPEQSLADRLEKARVALEPSMNYGDRLEKEADLRNLLLDNIDKIVAALRSAESAREGETNIVWRLAHPYRRFREDDQFAFVGELCLGSMSKEFGAERWRWEAPILLTIKNDVGWSSSYTKLKGEDASESLAKAACENAIRQHWFAPQPKLAQEDRAVGEDEAGEA